MITAKFHFQCVNCGTLYKESQLTYLCPACSESNSGKIPLLGVLKVIYNYKEMISNGITLSQLKNNTYLDLLPVETTESLPNLHIGNTPLYAINRINNRELPFNLFLKDDSQNPTFSFKDRASSIVSAYAKEKGYDTIVAASTGNAGSSLAGICAAQGQKAVILIPESAPIAKLTQILMYGATIIPVRGTYDDAFDLSIEASEEFGWYNRNTAYNPFTVEGKKTAAFELFDQLNNSVPDKIFIPVGDGVILSGIYKGFEDLLNLGFVDHMPTIVAVQAKESDNLVRNLDNTKFKIVKSTTIADSISVDIPRNFYMAQKYIRDYKGEHLSISDDEILQASSILSKNTGLFAEPAAAAAFAGFLAYENAGTLPAGSNNIVLLTGSGLKDIKAVSGILNMPDSIDPDIENLKKALL